MDQPKDRDSLWNLVASPLLWAAHLLLSYCTAAVWCAKFVGEEGSLAPIRVAIGVYTALAMIGVALIGWRGWQKHRSLGTGLPHDVDSTGDRRRFLGFTVLLLSGLSGLAVFYQGLTVVFIGSCQ